MINMNIKRYTVITAALALVFTYFSAHAQIGKRFPSELKVVKDPITETMLTFDMFRKALFKSGPIPSLV
jgi:hypothetical protein